MEEIFEIFDRENKIVGEAPRNEVHKKGLFHKAVNVFLLKDGKVFLQKRSETVDTSPGCWSESVGEHCKPGESYEETAKRGLKEELGIRNAKLTEIGSPKLRYAEWNGSIDNEVNALFLAESDEEPSIDHKEVSDGTFFSIEEVDKVMGERKFTSTFPELWKDFKEWLSKHGTA